MRIVTLVALLLTCIIGTSQTNLTSFLNEERRVIDSSHLARYFSEAILVGDSGWRETVYFLPQGTIESISYYTDRQLAVKNGKQISYHSNGYLRSIGTFIGNKKNGIWLTYHYNGQLKDSAVYRNDTIASVKVSWHSNNQQRDSISVDANGNGLQMSWFRNGAPASAGRLKNHQKWGKWQYLDNNGKLAAIIQYADDNEVGKRLYANANGELVPTNDKEVGQPAVFEHPKKWSYLTYLKNTLKNPDGYYVKENAIAQLTVLFAVTDEGEVVDIEIVNPIHPAYDAEVKKVIQQGGQYWRPAKQYNRTVPYLMKQSFSFISEEE